MHRRAAEDASFRGGHRRMLYGRGLTTSLSETEHFLFFAATRATAACSSAKFPCCRRVLA